MEPKDFVYTDKNRGSIRYIGTIDDPNKDYTFNPETYNSLKNTGKYREAKEYLEQYSYDSPSYFNKVQRMKDQCDTWIMYKQREYDLTSEEDKQKLDFINNYNNNPNDLDLENPYSREYTTLVNKMFGDSDVAELNFTKEKRSFIFDILAKDNTTNNIHAYKKRLAESLGMESISDASLRNKGIDIQYGDYDGSGTIRISKSSPYLKEIINSVIVDRFEPELYRVKDNGEKQLADDEYIQTDVTLRNSYINRIQQLVKDCSSVKSKANLNDDFVNESVNYPLVFQGSDEYDERINNGGTDGSAASKMRDLYEEQLIGALRTMLPGKQDIRVFAGPSEVMSNDKNGLAIRDDEKQAKLLELANRAGTKVVPSLNITNDGRCGITFAIQSKDDKGGDRLVFTVYDWNTEQINEIMNNNPEYRAIRKANEISRYNGTYTALDGNYYTYIGGGYGAYAIYEDGDGNRLSVNKVQDIIMRDDLIRRSVNDILIRTNTRTGNNITDKNYNNYLDAASISIGAQILKQNPIDATGKPLSLSDIQKFINLSDEQATINNDLSVNDYSYPILNYIRDVKIMLNNKLQEYYVNRQTR